MNTKKKLVISLTSLAIVLVAAITAVGIALAALTGTVDSNFTIKYTAYNVSATVSATYKVGESGPEQKFTGGTEDGSITFNPDTETATGTLKVDAPITLDTTNRFVVVTYTFKNNWNDETEKSKLVVTASPTTINGEGNEGIEIQYETNGADSFDDGSLAGLSPVEPNDTLTVKIKFSLAAQGSKSVNLQVKLNWTLTSQKIDG